MSDPTAVADVTVRLTGDGPWTVQEVDGGIELTSPRTSGITVQTGVRLLLDRAALGSLVDAVKRAG